MFPFLVSIKGNVFIPYFYCFIIFNSPVSFPVGGVSSAVLLHNVTMQTLESNQLWLNLHQTTFHETNQNPTSASSLALTHLCVNSCLHLSGSFSLWHLKAVISSNAPGSRHVDLWTTIGLVSRGRQTASPPKSIFATKWIKGWNNRFHMREPPVANKTAGNILVKVFFRAVFRSVRTVLMGSTHLGH